MELDPQELLARGTVAGKAESNHGDVRYVAHRGRFSTEHGQVDGIVTMLLIDCAERKRTRIGIWFGPDPDPEGAAEDLDLTGTNADEAEIGSFLDHFSFCEPV